MCSLHYGFVWISEPMVVDFIRSIVSEQLCYQRITRLLYGIYSDQQYKN